MNRLTSPYRERLWTIGNGSGRHEVRSVRPLEGWTTVRIDRLYHATMKRIAKDSSRGAGSISVDRWTELGRRFTTRFRHY